MKRRDLLQLASASVLGLLLPSWLFPKKAARLVVPGFTAPRIRHVEPELYSPEVYGCRLAAKKKPTWLEGHEKKYGPAKTQAEINAAYEPLHIFDGPERPATTEEVQALIYRWNGIYPSDAEVEALAGNPSLDEYRWRLGDRSQPPPRQCVVPLQEGGFSRLT